MSISATYVSATQFTVTGDRTPNVPATLRIQAIMGVDGTVEVTVNAASYDGRQRAHYRGGPRSRTDREPHDHQACCSLCRRSACIVKSSPHEHTGPFNGGAIAAAGMSQAEVAALQEHPVPGTGDARKFMRVTDAEDGYELFALMGAADQLIGMNDAGDEIASKTLQGTANRVTVSHAADTITLSGPQDVHPGSEPEFSGLTLSSLTGVLIGNGAASLSALAATAALQMVRRNAANSAYEFFAPALKDLSDVADSLTNSGAAGDIPVRGVSAYDRLAKGTFGQALVVDESGAVAWEAYRQVITGTAGEALSQYNMVYADSADSGEWKKASAAGASKVRDAWGMVIESGGISNGSSGSIQLFGMVTNGSWSWTPGTILYLSDTAGDLSETPGTATVAVAHALSGSSIFFFPGGSASGSAAGLAGEVVGTAGEPLGIYDVVYADDTDSGTYKKARSDATSAQANAVGIVTEVGGIADTATGAVTLFGLVTNPGWSWTPGADVYVAASAGGITQTVPTGYGAYVKPLGFALSATQIWFNPQNGWIIGSAPSTITGPLARSIVDGRIERQSDTELSFEGSAVGAWTGYEWYLADPGQTSLANTATDLDGTPLAVDSMYAIFAEYQGDGSFDLVADRWTSQGTDYAALYSHQGVLVQADTDAGRKRRFLGAVYMHNDASTPKFKDEETLRYVANWYNRKDKVVRSYNSTGGAWNYATNSWRELNGGSNHVRGRVVVIEPVNVLCAFGLIVLDSSNRADIGIGLDETTNVQDGYAIIHVGNANNTVSATCKLALTTGAHYITMIEKATAAATFTVWGSSASTNAYATVRM
jgi:hypothetical protein